MPVQFRIASHTVLDRDVVEIWHNGEFIGQITSGDGAGVRVISKHKLEAKILGKLTSISVSGNPANMIAVEVGG